jgi:sugar phosphate isomerase/epimerase
VIPLGIFSKTFARPTVEEAFREVASRNLPFVQFNFSTAGLPTLPDQIEQPVIDEIRSAMERHSIQIAAASGTFNLIDPDFESRDQSLRRLAVLAAACEALAAPVITLCTGTRNPDDMWCDHPDNATAAAWDEMVESIRLAIWITEPFNVKLAVEPERGNVMRDAQKARKLLDEIRSPRLGIVFDAANILAGKPDEPQRDVLDEAFELLGDNIALAHGKEFVREDAIVRIPGKGELDWGLYLSRLAETSYSGPLILHGFADDQADESVAFVRDVLQRIDIHS